VSVRRLHGHSGLIQHIAGRARPTQQAVSGRTQGRIGIAERSTLRWADRLAGKNLTLPREATASPDDLSGVQRPTSTSRPLIKTCARRPRARSDQLTIGYLTKQRLPKAAWDQAIRDDAAIPFSATRNLLSVATTGTALYQGGGKDVGASSAAAVGGSVMVAQTKCPSFRH
jgi:hypothetical protein